MLDFQYVFDSVFGAVQSASRTTEMRGSSYVYIKHFRREDDRSALKRELTPETQPPQCGSVRYLGERACDHAHAGRFSQREYPEASIKVPRERQQT